MNTARRRSLVISRQGGMFYEASVCLFVFLSLCLFLLTTSRKYYTVRENFYYGLSVENEVLRSD